MRSEKVTINLSTVELAQIDFLVERGLYANRSDFIRLAVRKQTEEHKREIDQFVDHSSHGLVDEVEEFGLSFLWGIGVNKIGQRDIEAMLRNGEKINIRMIGSLTIEKDVNPEQFKKVLHCIKIFGKVSAEPEIKKMIEEFS